MKYYIIAGEASGDLHASNLMKSIKKMDANADFRIWGGDKMVNEGGTLVKHIKDLAFMGFVEVLLNLKTILGNIKLCQKDLMNYQADALILVDYPGFNLRIAEFAHKKGLKVFYYISPQVWAWKKKRVHKIKRVVDELYCILPFEPDFYKQNDYNATFVGNPLLDAIQQFQQQAQSRIDFINNNQVDSQQPILAILPGSRNQEIKEKLPIMLEASKAFPDYQAVIAVAPHQPIEFYKEFTEGYQVYFVENQTYDLLNQSQLAMVTSGTATLETALFNVPQVVCYKGNPISVFIAKRLVNIKYISLVNLIMDKEVVTELIQEKLTVKRLINELKLIESEENPKRQQQLEDYKQLKHILGDGGASDYVAELLMKSLQ